MKPPALQSLLPLLDAFIKNADTLSSVERQQARMLSGLLLSIILPLPVFLLLFATVGSWLLAGMTIGAIAVIVGFVGWFWRTGNRAVVSHSLLVMGTAALVVAAVYTGGHSAPALAFLIVIPPIAFVLLGRRWGAAWVGICAVTVAGLGLVEAVGISLPPPPAYLGSPLISLVNIGTSALYAFAVVLFLDGLNRLKHEQLGEARKHAESANEAKSRFLATISHDLRTPMNGVLGLVEVLLLESDGLSDHQRSTLATVKASGEDLVHLVDDLLDLSKIEAGKLELDRAAIDPAHIAARVVGLLAQRAKGRGVRLVCEVGPDVGWGLGDPGRLQQVLVNLVGNAVKFTEDGSVTVRVARTGDQVQIEVQDTGIGIAPEVQARLFLPFEQAEASTARRFGGSGLGLAICQRIVEMMGGTLVVDSLVGVGSTFRFAIDLPRCDPPVDIAPAVAPAALPDGLRVLVAEDNVVNQMVIRRTLGQLKVRVRVVDDGSLVLAALEEELPDLVLMDLHMLDVGGIAAARLIREAQYQVPIVALTASALPDDREAALEAGMNGFLSKPLRLDELRQVLVGVAAGKRAA